MSEEQTAQTAQSGQLSEVDPILTNDLSDVSPDGPLIPANEYVFEVKKVEQKKSQSSGNNMLSIQLANTDPITSVTGEAIPAGAVTLFGRVMLTPTEKMTKERIQRDLKKFQLACGIKSGPIHPFEQYIGKALRVKVGFSKKTDEYPDDRNEIKSFVVP